MAVTLGALELVATFNCISVTLPWIGGTEEATMWAEIEWKPTSSGVWRSATMTADFGLPNGDWYTGGNVFSPVIDRRATAGDTNPNPLQYTIRGSVMVWNPGVSYDIRVIVHEPVAGDQIVSGGITTLSEVYPQSGGLTKYVSPTGSGDGSPGNPYGPSQIVPNHNPGDTFVLLDTATKYAPLILNGLNGSPTGPNWVRITGQTDGPNGRPIFRGAGPAENSGDILILSNSSYVKLDLMTMEASEKSNIRVVDCNNIAIYDMVMTVGSNLNVPTNVTPYGGGVRIVRTHHIYVFDSSFNITGFGGLDEPIDGGRKGAYIAVEVSDNHTTGVTVIGRHSITGQPMDAITGEGPNRNATAGYGPHCDIHDIDIVCDIENTLCGDDSIEIEAGNSHCRVWNCSTDKQRNGYSCAGVTLGPVYVFRSKIKWARQQCIKTDNSGDGYAFFLHITIRNGKAGAPLVAGHGGSEFSRRYIFLNCIFVANNKQTTSQIWHWTAGGQPGQWFNRNCHATGLSNPNQHFRTIAAVRPTGTDHTTLAAFKTATGGEPFGIQADPLFADLNTLALSESSPCRNAPGGGVIPMVNDEFSLWPYSGEAPDIGAVEFQEGDAVVSKEQISSIEALSRVVRQGVTSTESFITPIPPPKVTMLVNEGTDLWLTNKSRFSVASNQFTRGSFGSRRRSRHRRISSTTPRFLSSVTPRRRKFQVLEGSRSRRTTYRTHVLS